MKLENSEKLWDRAQKRLAQGQPGTNSKRPSHFIEGVYPKFMARGQGPYLWDVDGNKYTDFIGALGPVILGYSYPSVNEAVIKAVKNGGIFSLPSHLECEVAEELGEWLGIEKMRFFCNGDDATTAAVRIARAFTGSVLVESQGYHGCSDTWTSLTPPALGCLTSDELVVCGSAGLEEINILEPVALDASEERKKYLQDLKASVTIYDEIVTGTRVPTGTIAKWWGLKPDLMCLGKGIANGYPISVVGGKHELMDCGDYFLSRTFAAHPVSLAACQSTIRELKRKNLGDLYFYAQRFQKRLNETCKEIGVEWVGYGTRCQMQETPEQKVVNGMSLLMQEAIKSGVLLGRALYYHFGHLEAQIDEQVINILGDCVNRIRTGSVKLEGEKPRWSFKR